MGKLKRLLTFLLLVGVSLSSAQFSDTKPQASGANDSVCFAVKDTTPLSFNFSETGRSERSGSKSVMATLREEVRSFADKLPELSLSWLGVSCYVRNPLRYKLDPGISYEHQIGFRKGDWTLSIDGIGTNTLGDVNIALQYPVSPSMNVFVRYTDTQYRIDFQAWGKLPWE